MKIRKTCILTIALLFSIALVAQMPGSEKQGCSLRTMEGSYGSYAQGTFLAQVPGFPTAPFQVVAVALHVFDGKGNWSLTYATSLGGEIVPWGSTAVGTYSVTANCELSVLGAASSGSAVKFTGTITGSGIYQEAYITYTDPARVQSGILRKTPPSGCTLRTIEGTYGVFGEGLATLPNVSSMVPVAHIGTFVADGQGTFSGGETVKIDGMVVTDTYTATYNVNPDCSVVAEITAPSGVVHKVGTITGVGPFEEIHLISTDPGFVFADTMKRK